MTEPGSLPGTTTPRATTLAKRLSLSFALLGALMAVAFAAAGWAYYGQVHARGHLINVVDKARLEAAALFSDYVDEETGVRGYTLSGKSGFLQPYALGSAQAKTDRQKLGALERQDPRSYRLLGALDKALGQWEHQYALPAIRATAKGRRTYATEAKLQVGKDDFDVIRARFAHLDSALAASAASSASTMGATQDIFVVVAVALLAMLVAAGGVSAWALRSWVTAPLGVLRGDVRAVAEGNLGHSVVPVGPPDLAQLAQDVEAMRLRIVAEVHSLAEASEDLRETNADLARSNLELEQFAYVASHDLQEPLRKVVGFCELLQRRYAGQLDERAQQYITFAVDGATRMQVLINDLLAFSRVGRNTSRFEPVNLNDVYRQALANLETAIADKQAAVTAETLPTVRGDPALLTALFQNLIGNAIKFNPRDDPRVEVSVNRDGSEWLLSVTDNGIGIEPRFADRVFVIFQRLHGRDEYTGTGIGLALCKKIVEFHGGRVWVDTSYANGARMWLTLPAIGAKR